MRSFLRLENIIKNVKVVTAKLPQSVGERRYYTIINSRHPFQNDLGPNSCVANYSSLPKAIAGHIRRVFDVLLHPQEYSLA